jgi:hypothetical protein
MIVSRPARQHQGPTRGRHAIRRAGLCQEAQRLRHSQGTLPRGVYRTRMSEVRMFGVCTTTRLAPHALRHLTQFLERISAVGLPVNTG